MSKVKYTKLTLRLSQEERDRVELLRDDLAADLGTHTLSATIRIALSLLAQQRGITVPTTTAA